MADGVAAQSGNPEVTLDASRPNTLVNDQIFNLRLITNKLENAYNGMDVEWDGNDRRPIYPTTLYRRRRRQFTMITCLSYYLDSVGNGSGSGSGSGDGTDSMEEDDDEDRERVKPSGGHNNAHRGSAVDSNRHQPNSKPGPYDGIAKNSVPSTEDDDNDEDEDDDDIEFTSGGATPKSENKGSPTSSSAPPADSTQQPLSPNKALTSYLVPIVVMWLGNMF